MALTALPPMYLIPLQTNFLCVNLNHNTVFKMFIVFWTAIILYTCILRIFEMLMIHFTSYCHSDKFMGPRNAYLRPLFPSKYSANTSSKVNFVFRCSFGYPVRIIREVNIRREIQSCVLCAVFALSELMCENALVAPYHEYKWISLYEMSANLVRESLELVESAGNNKEHFNFFRRDCSDVNHIVWYSGANS
jgi:hypothetical protein